MPKTLKYDFCLVPLYENYLIAHINEGFHVLSEHNKVLLELAQSYYKNRSFVYITERINSYSVDPQIYFQTSKIQNLVGIAVVSKKYMAKSNADVEKMFFSKPFETFKDIEEAKDWANALVTG